MRSRRPVVSQPEPKNIAHLYLLFSCGAARVAAPDRPLSPGRAPDVLFMRWASWVSKLNMYKYSCTSVRYYTLSRAL